MSDGHASDLLQGMDAVPWANIRHAYGPATDAPDLLRALCSGDERRRRDAWQELYGNLWQQGTIDAATSSAAPFLIQLLDAEAVIAKEEILVYLAFLFLGKGYWVVRGVQEWPGRPPEDKLAQIVAEEHRWRDATRAAIRMGTETYFRLLCTRDQTLRLAAAYLLGLVGDDTPEIVEDILRTEAT